MIVIELLLATAFNCHESQELIDGITQYQTLEAYKEELRSWPHPRSIKGVKSLAEWRGATAGYNAAEGFLLGRKIK